MEVRLIHFNKARWDETFQYTIDMLSQFPKPTPRCQLYFFPFFSAKHYIIYLHPCISALIYQYKVLLFKIYADQLRTVVYIEKLKYEDEAKLKW